MRAVCPSRTGDEARWKRPGSEDMSSKTLNEKLDAEKMGHQNPGTAASELAPH